MLLRRSMIEAVPTSRSKLQGHSGAITRGPRSRTKKTEALRVRRSRVQIRTWYSRSSWSLVTHQTSMKQKENLFKGTGSREIKPQEILGTEDLNSIRAFSSLPSFLLAPSSLGPFWQKYQQGSFLIYTTDPSAGRETKPPSLSWFQSLKVDLSSSAEVTQLPWKGQHHICTFVYTVQKHRFPEKQSCSDNPRHVQFWEPRLGLRQQTLSYKSEANDYGLYLG